jgi:protein SCO1/2
MNRKSTITTVIVAALLVGAVTGWFLAGRMPTDEPVRGGDFTLQSADGPVALADLRGKVVLIYFGYASCPDVCPTSLALAAQGLALLAPGELQRLRVLFVSLDPARDTPQKLKEYAAHFHPGITGVTGSPEAVAGVARNYGAAFRIQKVESAAGYVVDHTSFTSVVAPDGRLVEQLPHGALPAEIATVVRRTLNP